MKANSVFLLGVLFVLIAYGVFFVTRSRRFGWKTRHGLIVSLVILFTVIGSILLSSSSDSNNNHQESFFFEVSPKRKACLEAQVSLSNEDDDNAVVTGDCVGCCGKGTKGGIPSRYSDYGLTLGDPDDGYIHNDWARNDLFDSCR